MTERALRPLTEEAYLALERESPLRHELLGGIPYAMAGASLDHNLLVTHLVDLLGYLTLESGRRGGRLYRRTPEGLLPEALREVLHLPCLQGPVPLEAIYEGVA